MTGRWIVPALGAALLLAACGGGEKEGAGARGDAAGTTGGKDAASLSPEAAEAAGIAASVRAVDAAMAAAAIPLPEPEPEEGE